MAGLLDALLDPQFRKDVRQGLTDAANRGAVAGLLGGPVDMATGLLNAALMGGGYLGNKAGLLSASQMPRPIVNAVGGSEWIGQKMQDAGMVSGNRNQVAEMLAGVAIPAAMPRLGQAAFAAEQAAPRVVEKYGMAAERGLAPLVEAGLNRGGLAREVIGAMANNTVSPATVYHGSPHKFDRFDSSKIGTGEGAQAYGHGLYLAESPSVAKSYADTLSQYHIGTRDGIKSGGDFADALVANAGEYPASLSSAIRSQANKVATDVAGGKTAEQVIATMRNGPYSRMYAGLADAVEKMAPTKAGGSLYKVDLPDDAIAKMLDWDAALAKQPQSVQQALDSLQKKNPVGWNALVESQLGGPVMEQATGRDLYRRMHEGLILSGKAQPAAIKEQQAAEMLRRAGIPGIRYLDGGSRGAGQGSSNFVVFPGEESLLTILERNGQPLR